MTKQHRLVLIGDSAFAEVAHEYFTCDSDYEVVAFTVEKEHVRRDMFLGLPVVPFEELEQRYIPADHYFFAAVVYTQQNRLRARLYQEAKAKGFRPASYISRQAFVWRDVRLGDHCFIFENNVIQPRVRIGDNVVLWSGNHIGHHSVIGDHCFFSSHVVISGYVAVGESCFFGVNATVGNNVAIGEKSLIGAGALVLADVPARKVVSGVWRKAPAASSTALQQG
jgi:sugar O-acyltransferase (sialic acid O-acetyltransferase NeuD family)